VSAREQREYSRRAEPDFNAARLQLSRLHAPAGARLRDVWIQLANLTATTLRVERVGVWILVDEGRAIRCRYLLQRSSHQVFQGAVLRAQDFPAYFGALESNRTIAADNAVAESTTRELREAYLEPLGITSILDAPIYLEGHLVGVVCHEHVGRPRTWTEQEKNFVAAVADNIARLYGEHERQQAASVLQVYQEHLLELHRLEAVGRMAAGIAHDFRGIIGAALGFAELMRRVPNLPAQADHYAQRIVDSLERGRQLSQQVMSFGKDEAAAPRVLDTRAVIEGMASMFRVMLGDQVRFALACDSAVSRVFLDPSQLERMLLNLVLNARDAMTKGGDLTVSVEDIGVEGEDDEEMTYVAITVSDTGIGMDAETQKNARNPFFTTKGEQGTGLGLAIVEQIATRAGGHIRIDSEPGRGTSVVICLPRIAGALE